MGKRVSVILNFKDELEREALPSIRHSFGFTRRSGVSNNRQCRRTGFEQLDDAIISAQHGKIDQELHTKLHTMLIEVGSQAEALLVLEGDNR